MGSLWFLGFLFLMLATTLSSSNPFPDEISQNQTNIQLRLYHIPKPNSSISTKSFFQALLSGDQTRVNSLQSLLSGDRTRLNSLRSSSKPKQTELKSVNIPLNPGTSIGTGNYYVKIGMGSPAKYYAVVMDTGSSLTWLQCQPCAVYCHSQSGPVFDPAGSATYTKLKCGSPECASTKRATLNDPFCDRSDTCVYTASYGDASFSVGYLSRDRLALAPAQALPGFVFGCGQDNQGLFGQAAGLLGLARDRLSLLNQASPKYGNAFSYCLPSVNRGKGGFLSVGTEASVAAKNCVFTPMLTDAKNPSLYFLRLSTITVGEKPVPAATSAYKVPTIIDSGTVITRLPRAVYNALSSAFGAAVAGKLAKAEAFSILDTCYKAGMASAVRAVPEVRLVFGGGAELRLAAENVLVEVDDDVVCLAFAATDGIAIVGNRQQQSFRVVYDVAKARIGFAPGGCS